MWNGKLLRSKQIYGSTPTISMTENNFLFPWVIKRTSFFLVLVIRSFSQIPWAFSKLLQSRRLTKFWVSKLVENDFVTRRISSILCISKKKRKKKGGFVKNITPCILISNIINMFLKFVFENVILVIYIDTNFRCSVHQWEKWFFKNK